MESINDDLRSFFIDQNQLIRFSSLYFRTCGFRKWRMEGLSSLKRSISFMSGDLGSPIACGTFLTKPIGALMS
ncbi:uncharacterized protein G2W53_018862 [Senna tora]|uniref:Uncharacterized protein n=1 Tax=Senna tora TaxID=362788 RepID=A0A834TSP1_9FABA|nr:uncharacterized protein G2W53_018862 [Senna tora]